MAKRKSDALLGKDKAYNSQFAPAANLVGHGQDGIVPDISSYISNSAYVSRDVFCIVLQTPRMFNYLPDAPIWHSTLKAIMETGTKTIEGLNSTLTVDYVSNPLGGSGEQQEDVAKVQRARSEITHTVTEKQGFIVNAFFDAYINYCIGDPDSGIPAITSLEGLPEDIDFFPDQYTFSSIYIEPDPLHRKVVKAWLMTNQAPKTGGTVEGRRDRTAAGASVDHAIGLTGIQQVGAGVKTYAQAILDEINLTGLNPNRREAFLQEIAADVKAGSAGYSELVQQVAAQTI